MRLSTHVERRWSGPRDEQWHAGSHVHSHCAENTPCEYNRPEWPPASYSKRSRWILKTSWNYADNKYYMPYLTLEFRFIKINTRLYKFTRIECWHLKSNTARRGASPSTSSRIEPCTCRSRTRPSDTFPRGPGCQSRPSTRRMTRPNRPPFHPNGSDSISLFLNQSNLKQKKTVCLSFKYMASNLQLAILCA